MVTAEHPGGGRIPGVQGLRAIAILLVVAYHAGLPIGAGYIGVDVFFVISGFVITRMILRQSAGTGRIDFRAFWAGRIRRLLPALAVMVVLTVALAVPLGSPAGSQEDTALSGIAANLWISNAVLAYLTLGYFGARAEENPLLHTWSLAVEEQFYIFFPILVAFGLFVARRRAWHQSTSVAALLLVVAVPSFVLCVFLTFVPLPVPIGGALAFFSPVTRAWEFVAGALLALALHRGWVPSARLTGISGPVGVALLATALVATRDPSAFPGWIAAVPVTATCFLLLACVSDGQVSRILGARPLTLIGDVSYGWYLFHWPVLVYTRGFWLPGQAPMWIEVLAVLLALAVALVSFRWIEEPIRHRRVFGRVPTVALGSSIVIPAVLLSVAVTAGASTGFGNARLASMHEQLDHDQWKYQKVCQSPVEVSDRSMQTCRVPGEASGRPIVLMGDSNAGMYADAVVDAARQMDRTVTVATVPSCPLVDVEQIELGKKTWLDCAAHFRASMAWLQAQGPSVVVIASGAGAVDWDLQALRLPDGSLAVTAAEKAEAWRESLERTYRAIGEMGSVVVPISTIPHFRQGELAWSPRHCRAIDVLRSVDECGLSKPRAEADAEQRGALAAERAAAAAVGAPVLDVRTALCPEDRCATNDGDVWFYEDGGHLSYPRAMGLRSLLVEALTDRR